MGISSSKQKVSSTQKENATTTPTTPSWISQPLQGYAGKVTDFMNSDPAQFVAGASPLQQQAFSSAQSLGGSKATFEDAIGNAKAAGGAAAGSVDLRGYEAPRLGNVHEVQSQSLLDGLDRYLDPALNDVVKATLADYDAKSGQQAAQLAGQAAASGAFGGSRYGLTQGEFQASTARDRALTDAQLRAQAFSQAISASGQDAQRRQDAGLYNAGAWNTHDLTQGGFDENAARYGADVANQESMFNQQERDAALARQLQAAGLTGELANSMSADDRANISLAADLGQAQREIEAARLGAPLAQLQAAGQLYGAIPYSSFTGQQVNSNSSGTNVTKSTPSLFNQALAGASLAFSDRRLKRDLVKIGEFDDGLGVYEFGYRRGTGLNLPPGRFRGVLAHEVEALRPWALGPKHDGFATVDYRRLNS